MTMVQVWPQIGLQMGNQQPELKKKPILKDSKGLPMQSTLPVVWPNGLPVSKWLPAKTSWVGTQIWATVWAWLPSTKQIEQAKPFIQEQINTEAPVSTNVSKPKTDYTLSKIDIIEKAKREHPRLQEWIDAGVITVEDIYAKVLQEHPKIKALHDQWEIDMGEVMVDNKLSTELKDASQDSAIRWLVAGWAWLLTLWINKLLRSPEEFSNFIQENVSKLKSRLVWWVKEVDRPLINQAADIVAQYADDNIKTFWDLANNFDNIKSKYYQDSGLKQVYDNIKIKKTDPIIKRIDDMTKAMLDTLKTKGKVKLWLEDMYQSIVDIRDKMFTGKLTGTEANQVKKKINEFFNVFSADGDVKGWLTKQWAGKIYDELKAFLEWAAENIWDVNVKAKNKAYQWLLVMEDYITKMADSASKSSAKTKDVWFAQRMVQKVMEIADIIPWISSAKGAIQWALKSFWVGNAQMSTSEIEKQLPEILDRIRKATKDDSIVNYLGETISEWAKKWIPKIVNWWKEVLKKLKWWLFWTVAWILFDKYNPWMNAVFTSLDYLDNPDNYYEWTGMFESYVLPKDVVDDIVDENGYFEIDDNWYKLDDDGFRSVTKV